MYALIKSSNKYLTAFKNAWQHALEYRIDNLIRFFISAISMISVFYLWSDVFAGKASIVGYSQREIVTYYLLIHYFFAANGVWVPISEHIKDGELSIYLTKSINYLWYLYFDSIAKNLFRLIIGLPVVIFFFVVFKNSFYFDLNLSSLSVMAIAYLGATSIIFLINCLHGMIEFWWLHGASTMDMFFMILTSFFSGMMIPLFLFPQYLQNIAAFIPYQYTNYFVVNSFLGKINFMAAFQGICIQLVWILVLALAVNFVWKRGIKRYEAYGG